MAQKKRPRAIRSTDVSDRVGSATDEPSVEGIQVVEDWPIEGLSAAYDKLGRAGRPEDVIGALRRHAVDAGLPLPAGRGLNEAFAWVFDLLRRRRLVKDWGEHPATVDWFCLHVPPGGSASFALENKSKKKAGVTLKLLGAGVGSGRGVTLSVKQNFLERKRCARLTQHVTVRVRTFDIGRGPEHPEIEPSVTGVRHLEVRPWDTCPMCGRRSKELDPFEYVQAGPGLDLTRDDVGQKRSEIVQLSVNHRAEVEIPVPIPGLGGSGKIGLSSEREFELTCSTDYTFPPRAFFTPYRPAGAQVDLPFWAVQ